MLCTVQKESLDKLRSKYLLVHIFRLGIVDILLDIEKLRPEFKKCVQVFCNIFSHNVRVNGMNARFFGFFLDSFSLTYILINLEGQVF